MSQLERLLLAGLVVLVALAVLPRLPSEAVTFPQPNPTYRDVSVPVSPGETLARIEADTNGIGVFGLAFYENNTDKLQVATMGGVVPSVESIASGEYPVTRPLYFYVKKAHVGSIPGIAEYLAEFTSEKAWGENGYLSDKGLIPMPAEERAQTAKNTKELNAM